MQYFYSLVAFFLLLSSSTARAHSVSGQILNERQAVSIKFLYSTGDPAPYAQIKVYGPEDQNIEYQNARTDKHGSFSFLPDAAGRWTVVMSDNMGHKTECLVNVQDIPSAGSTETTPSIATTAAQSPHNRLLVRSVFGVSLLLNIFIGLYLLIKRQKQGWEHAH